MLFYVQRLNQRPWHTKRYVKLDRGEMARQCKAQGIETPIFQRWKGGACFWGYDNICQVGFVQSSAGGTFNVFMMTSEYRALDAWTERDEVITREVRWLFDEMGSSEGVYESVRRLERELREVKEEVEKLKRIVGPGFTGW